MWKLFIDQGWGPKNHGEKASADALKETAKELHQLAKNSADIIYYIYDPHGKLTFKSANNASWRMRWKKANGRETLDQLLAA